MKRAFKFHGNIAVFVAAVTLVIAVLLSSGYMVIKFINTVFPSKYLAEYAECVSVAELDALAEAEYLNE